MNRHPVLILFIFLKIFDLLARKNWGGVFNQKIFFGALAGNTAGIVILLFFLSGIFLFLRRRRKRPNFFESLILAGTASNLVDRLFFGGVFDYVSLPPFPAFNLADIFIVSGILCFAASGLKKNKSAILPDQR